MKHRFGSFLVGAVATALVASLTFSAIAISGRMTIEVDPVNVQVNGEVFAPKDVNGADVPVFAYNGTTYAPLRALAESYGLEVGYDAASNMATVGNPEKALTSVPTSAPAESSSNMDYSDWTDEENAIYKELVEEWEYEYGILDESKAPNQALYFGTPKSGTTSITEDTINQLTHVKELIYRVLHDVDYTVKNDIGIVYPFGSFSAVGDEFIVFF